jgi:hypothetical protein
MKKIMAYGLAVLIACAAQGAWAQPVKPEPTKKTEGTTAEKSNPKGKNSKGWKTRFKEGKKFRPEKFKSSTQQ